MDQEHIESDTSSNSTVDEQLTPEQSDIPAKRKKMDELPEEVNFLTDDNVGSSPERYTYSDESQSQGSNDSPYFAFKSQYNCVASEYNKKYQYPNRNNRNDSPDSYMNAPNRFKYNYRKRNAHGESNDENNTSWECCYCWMINAESDHQCVICSKYREFIHVVVLNWTCDSCTTVNESQNDKCIECGTEKPAHKANKMLAHCSAYVDYCITPGTSQTVSESKEGWSCVNCYTSNENGKSKCKFCETCKPESEDMAQPLTARHILPAIVESRPILPLYQQTTLGTKYPIISALLETSAQKADSEQSMNMPQVPGVNRKVSASVTSTVTSDSLSMTTVTAPIRIEKECNPNASADTIVPLKRKRKLEFTD